MLLLSVDFGVAHLLDFSLKVSIVFVVNHLGKSDLFGCGLETDDTVTHPYTEHSYTLVLRHVYMAHLTDEECLYGSPVSVSVAVRCVWFVVGLCPDCPWQHQ